MLLVKIAIRIIVLICAINDSFVLSNNNSRELIVSITPSIQKHRHVGHSMVPEIKSDSSNVSRVSLNQYSDGDLDISEDKLTFNEKENKGKLRDLRKLSSKSNFTPEFAFIFNLYDILLSNKSLNISMECTTGVKNLTELIDKGDILAKKLVDSSGKPSDNFNNGSSSLGQFTNCLYAEINEELKGKYCLIKLNVTIQRNYLQEMIGVVNNDGVRQAIGVCIPSSCNEEDISKAVNGSVQHLSRRVISADCKTKEGHPVLVSEIVVWTVLLTYVLIKVGVTSYDYWQQWYSQRVEDRRLILVILSIFSMRLDWEHLSSLETTEMGEGSWIECIDGIKSIGMVIIILGHTFSYATVNLFESVDGICSESRNMRHFFASWATLAVDGFYLMSGLVYFYATIKRYDLEVMKQNIITRGKRMGFYWRCIFRMYMRLTPVMMFLVTIGATVLHHSCSGPNYEESTSTYNGWCRKHWMWNLLHLQNFWDTEEMCFGPSWYISTDAQFSLFVPLLVMVTSTDKFDSCLYGAFTAGVALTIYFSWFDITREPDVMTEIPGHAFMTLYSYIAPYCMGVFLGYKMATVEIGPTSPEQIWRLIACAAIPLLTLTFILLQLLCPLPLFLAIILRVCIILLTSAALGCLIYSTHRHLMYFGRYFACLTRRGFKISSRLTYSAYLVHPLIMNYFYSCHVTYYVHLAMFIVYFLVYLIVTYIFAIFLFLFIEHPFRRLGQFILSPFEIRCNVKPPQ